MNFTLQNTFQTKFSKYLKNNARDLADMKVKAINDNNYQTLENFIEYEKYLGNSYFTQFITEYLERGRALLNNFI
jgi:pyruvate carboxylase